MSGNLRRAAIGLLIAAIGWFAWEGVLRNGFLYDDDTFIVLNQGIRSLSPVSKFFTRAATSDNPQMNQDVWRPLTTFSYAVNYKYAGADPRSFHLFNLLLHLLNALLVFLLCARLVSDGSARGAPAGARDDAAAFVAACAALVFLLHPVQVETVAWVSQRSNELFLLFYLSSFILFARASPRPTPRGAASLFCFLLALLSKEMAVSLPLALFGYLWIIRRRSAAESLRRVLPHAFVAVLFVLARSSVLGQTAQTTYWAGGFLPQMLTMLKGFFFYVRLMFVPYPLSVEYLFPSKSSVDAELLAYGLVFAAIGWAAWKSRRENPLISFGVFLFFASLGPVSNVIPIRTIINERFLYLGAVGFGLVLGGLLTARACSWRRPLRYLALAAFLAPYCSISAARIGDWKDHWSLVTASLRTCPQSATLHYGMGRAHASRGDFAQAEREYKVALSIDPTYAEALNDLGLISVREGRLDEAIVRYRQSIQKRVDFAEAIKGLGMAQLSQGLAAPGTEEGARALQAAVQALGRAAELKPQDDETRSNLAAAYAYTGRLEDAIALSQQVLQRDPGMSKTRRNLELFSRVRGASTSDYVKARFGGPEVLAKFAVPRPRLVRRGEFYEHPAGREEKLSYSLGRRYSDGYSLEYAGEKVSLRPLCPAADPDLTFEASAAVYRGAAPGVDILVVPSGPAFETLFLVNEPRSLSRLQYSVTGPGGADSVGLNGSGSLEVRSPGGEPLLTMSKPVLVDSRGKKVDGWYELAGGVLKMGFPETPLDYPVLIDPVWAAVGSMASAREAASATLLPDGTVLVAGGRSAAGTYLSTADLYNFTTGRFTATTGSMTGARAYHTAVLLPTGNVLLAGGNSATGTYLSTAQLYNPLTKTFAATTGNMTVARSSATATMLINNKVLIAGGRSATGTFLSTADLYDPVANTFAATTGAMTAARASHAATLLPDGAVLITGGQNAAGTFLSTAEIYNTGGSTFTATAAAMSAQRSGHTATLLPTAVVLITGGYSGAGAYSLTAEVYNIDGASFSATGSMLSARAFHTANALPDGKLLVAGGQNAAAAFLSSAEIYITTGAVFAATGNMTAVRFFQTATMLPSGTVLMAGGRSAAATFLSTTEVYNPTVGTFAATGSMTVARNAAAATLMTSGKELVSGGTATGGGSLSTADLYDPTTGTFSTTGPMTTYHRNHSTTLLPTGKVLVAGGLQTATQVGTTDAAGAVCELYTSSTGVFSVTGSLNTGRRWHSPVLLPDRTILVTGGQTTTTLSTNELYNVDGGTWSVTGSMTTRRAFHTATFLRDGRVLVVGGNSNGNNAANVLSTAELYTPTTKTFAATGSMTTRRFYQAEALLQNGFVLIAGGSNDGTVALSTAELYNPSLGTFATTGSMSTGRIYHTATLLPSGKILIAGGQNGTTYLSTAELYDPATGLFTPTPNAMTAGRVAHNAVNQGNGKVLIVGGLSAAGVSEASADLVSYTEYDYTAYSLINEPAIDTLSALSTVTFQVTGANFTGYGEGSSGGSQSSAANHGRVVLQFMDSGNYGFMPGNSDLVDLSTTNYPMSASQWANAATSMRFTVPPNLRNGNYMMYIIANGIPSPGYVINFNTGVVTQFTGYTTMVSTTTAGNWRWRRATLTETIPSGGPDDWDWRLATPGSGRLVPQLQGQDPLNWTWGGE